MNKTTNTIEPKLFTWKFHDHYTRIEDDQGPKHPRGARISPGWPAHPRVTPEYITADRLLHHQSMTIVEFLARVLYQKKWGFRSPRSIPSHSILSPSSLFLPMPTFTLYLCPPSCRSPRVRSLCYVFWLLALVGLILRWFNLEITPLSSSDANIVNTIVTPARASMGATRGEYARSL